MFARAMIRSVLLTTGVVGTFSQQPDLVHYTYSNYVNTFNKTPENAREEIFDANMKSILRHNADPDKTWVAGTNEFTDWTHSEFMAWVKSPRPDGPKKTEIQLAKVEGLPDTVDWRQKKGVITPVKWQGHHCKSCWTFATTETLESYFAIATGEDAPILAPQQIVSCCVIPGYGGCKGGTNHIAFNYTSTVGLTTEANYPYTAGDGIAGTCDPSKIKPDVINSGYVGLKTNDYEQLMNAVVMHGPIALSVSAHSNWKMYSSGIFSGDCGFEVNHAVQLVGYGEENSTMYWLVRNSWGSWYGESGYIRLKRFGKGNEPCGNMRDGTHACGMCAILWRSSFPKNVRKADVTVQKVLTV